MLWGRHLPVPPSCLRTHIAFTFACGHCHADGSTSSACGKKPRRPRFRSEREAGAVLTSLGRLLPTRNC